MKKITLSTCLKQRERILKQEAAGTIVLLDLDGGQYYALDDTGRRAWELCDGRRQVSEIGHVLTGEYEVSVEILENDLLELFTELRNENLVEASV